MDQVLEAIGRHGIVPVVVIDDDASAPALMEALSDGGLPVAEFTFRTEAAVAAIRRAVAAHPDALVGAGSVSDPGQVDAAVDAGARFIVSAGLDEEVVERALSRGVAALPGCATASELMRARRLGLDCVKFFPAEQLGGLRMLQAVAAPFPGLRFVPTGGVDAANAAEYLAEPRVLAVGGSWMVKTDLLRAAEWATVTRLAREAVDVVAQARARAGA
jgi:2-dehydro-3-deoxyphosphogluconate aldolase/(4S)-4-hydroxy-2-oxoglutarate aldolase